MRINFFEEYPIEENLLKIKLIDFPSTIFVASKSLDEFVKLKEKILQINDKIEVAYWPIIPRSYWFSPFSYTKDLKNFIDDVSKNDEPLKVLIDLELPLKNKWYLYFSNIFSFFNNKKIIKDFIKNAYKKNIKIVTAEYAPFNDFFVWLYKIIGISYNPREYNNSVCIMYYTSMNKNKTNNLIRKTILKIKEKNKNLELGLGTIATGVLENEPILSPENLEKDLIFVKENNFEIATIFRLGGLNEQYLKVINTVLEK